MVTIGNIVYSGTQILKSPSVDILSPMMKCWTLHFLVQKRGIATTTGNHAMSFIILLYLLPLCCIQIALTQNKEEVLLHVHIGQWEAKYSSYALKHISWIEVTTHCEGFYSDGHASRRVIIHRAKSKLTTPVFNFCQMSECPRWPSSSSSSSFQLLVSFCILLKLYLHIVAVYKCNCMI